MKTYQDSGYRYYFDTSLKLWTIYRVDDKGNQIDEDENGRMIESQYYNTKADLKKIHPELKFTPLVETEQDWKSQMNAFPKTIKG